MRNNETQQTIQKRIDDYKISLAALEAPGISLIDDGWRSYYNKAIKELVLLQGLHPRVEESLIAETLEHIALHVGAGQEPSNILFVFSGKRFIVEIKKQATIEELAIALGGLAGMLRFAVEEENKL